ncbi:MAG: IS3 family transposase, partial [Trueperella pyogenes]
ATRKQVYESVTEWIEVFYNRTRIHTSINGYSPVEYELKITAPLLQAAKNCQQLAVKPIHHADIHFTKGDSYRTRNKTTQKN